MRENNSVLFVVLLVVAGAMLKPAGQPINVERDTRPAAASQAMSRDADPAEPSANASCAALDLLSELLVLPIASSACGTPAEAADETIRQKLIAARIAALSSAARTLGFSIETLVATVPDPVESYAKWTFDRYLDAIRRGAEANEYVLDRYGPARWWKPDPDADPSAARLARPADAAGRHIEELGVIVFRSSSRREVVTRDADPGDVALVNGGGNRNGAGAANREQRALVVFLVPETAIAGVSPRAVVKALDSVAALSRLPCVAGVDRSTVRLVGPSFSGTSPSLANALHEWLKTPAGQAFNVRIVSGTADAEFNRNILERPPAAPASLSTSSPSMTASNVGRVRFQATVPTNRLLQHGLAEYLRSLTPETDVTRIALFVESNTGYGRSLLAAFRDSSRFRVDTVPFPMHISRLRTAATQQRGPTVRIPGVGSSAAPLRLDDKSTTLDALPAMTPDLTFSSVEVAMSRLLAMVADTRVRFVGILATDTRDKLFLADQVMKRCPNVTLFTFATDLLFLHPDFNSAVRGMIVASSYPLTADTQSWALHRRGDPLMQLHNNGSQGIYNATLAQLAYNADGRPLFVSSPPLLDYGPVGQEALDALKSDADPVGPMVWITTVGRDGLWPLIAYSPMAWLREKRQALADPARRPAADEDLLETFKRNQDYVFPMRANALKAAYDRVSGRRATTYVLEASRRVSFSVWTHGAFAIVTLLCFGQCLLYLAGLLPWIAPALTRACRARPLMRACLFNTDRRILRYQLACFAALWLTYRLVDLLVSLWAWSPDGPVDMSFALVRAISGTCLLLLTIITIVLTLLVCVDAFLHWHQRRTGGAAALRIDAVTVRRLLLGALVLWAGWSLDRFVAAHRWTPDTYWASLPFLLRAGSLGSGVSPTLPILLVAIGVYVWSLSNLRRVAYPPCVFAAPDDPALSLLTPLGGLHADVLEHRFKVTTDTSMSSIPSFWFIIVALTAGYTYLLAFHPTLMSFEGPAFGRAMSAVSTFLHVIIGLTLMQFLLLWRSLAALLNRLSRHPLLSAFAELGKKPTRLLVGGLASGMPSHHDLEIVLQYVPALMQLAAEPPSPHHVAQADASVGADAAATMSAEAHRLLQEALRPTDGSSLEDVLTSDLPERLDARSAVGPAVAPAAAAPAAPSACSPLRLAFVDRVCCPFMWSSSASWKRLVQVYRATVAVLEPRWHDSSSTPYVRQAELFVATLLVFGIQDVLARLGMLLVVIMTGVFVTFGAHTLFPFGPSQTLMGLAWVYLLVAATIALYVFVQVDRDPILGRVKGHPDPGRFTWNREIVTRIALYAGVPILSLLAAQFPDLMKILSEWLAPIQKALP